MCQVLPHSGSVQDERDRAPMRRAHWLYGKHHRNMFFVLLSSGQDVSGDSESYTDDKHLGCIMERVRDLTGKLGPRRRRTQKCRCKEKGDPEDSGVAGPGWA